MIYSILQISDLHKMKDTAYNNLLQSLIVDREKYVSKGILSPKYIVVCGDLIQGGTTDEEIDNQYADVENFLNELVDSFLNGDKSRIIIVPGNHDVNRSVTKDSMSQETLSDDVDRRTQQIKELSKGFIDPGNNIRWNWHDLNFYKISNKERYKHRFDRFKIFYDRFYSDIQEERVYPENSVKTAFIIKFDEDRLAFACFNSCHYLDHLNFAGNIDEDSVASVSGELRKLYDHGYLNIGVWHHHFYGDPYETNYMNRSVFNSMSLQDYIKIGLYGHQHKVDIAEEYTSRLFFDESQRNENKMLLISSGTLFGGDKTLPTGTKRQYNIIEIDNNEGHVTVNINIREDINPGVNSKYPIWSEHIIPYSTENKITANVVCKKYPIENIIRDIDSETRTSGDYVTGCSKLKPYIENTLAKEIYDEYLKECPPEFIINEISNPKTPNDFILLIDAIERTNRTDLASKLVTDEKLIKLSESDSFIKEMFENLKSKLN